VHVRIEFDHKAKWECEMKGFYGISYKLFVVCFVFVLGVVLLLSTISYQYIKNEIRMTQDEYAYQLLNKVEQYLDLYFLLTQNVLNAVSSTSHAWNGDFELAQEQLERMYADHLDYVSNLYLIRADHSIIGGNPITKVFNDPLPEREVIYQSAIQQLGLYVSEPYLSTYSGWTVTMATPLSHGGQLVVIAVDLHLQSLENRLLQISRNDENQLGIVTPSGVAVARSKAVDGGAIQMLEHQFIVGALSMQELTFPKDGILTTMTDIGQPLTVIKKRMTKFNWTVFAVMDDSRRQDTLERLQRAFIGLLALGLLLSLLVSAAVAKFIRRPVYRIIRTMRKVREGELDVQVAINRNDEFGELASTFDDMLQQIRQLIRNLNASEQMKRQLEIQVLQSQINPHFLYNTLGAICNVVSLRRYEQVDSIVAALIAILEYGVQDSSKKVPIEEELTNVRNYMLIQNIRYESHFNLLIDVPESLATYMVPRMILQPIVENSLFHGYNGGLLEGDVAIRACEESHLFVIEIVDTGVGMSKAAMDGLLHSSSAKKMDSSRTRIGLYNIHKRIQLNYGEQYGVRIRSVLNEGTSIRLEFKRGYIADEEL
jgi:two-component system sensor histidine kinase YesM